ncbi:MAG: hypothetical protein PHT31_06875 [Candidatus Omnitrophica bacterium]|nr:hypothetical protein [Candidatus Omnitrophota bacterium]MDD5653861.1 hypothetical protein [Candidatus Omnitrophota bacterium]
MKKRGGIFLIFALLCFLNNASAQDNTVAAQAWADSFADTAMQQFKPLDADQLSYPDIKAMVKSYALKLSQALLAAGLKDETIDSIIGQAGSSFGQAMDSLFQGKNFNQQVEKYSERIAGLLREQGLSIDSQSEIVSQGSISLNSIASFFRRSNQ